MANRARCRTVDVDVARRDEPTVAPPGCVTSIDVAPGMKSAPASVVAVPPATERDVCMGYDVVGVSGRSGVVGPGTGGVGQHDPADGDVAETGDGHRHVEEDRHGPTRDLDGVDRPDDVDVAGRELDPCRCAADLTGVLSTETSGAVVSAVGAPSNGQVTAAVSMPVRNSGRPSRSIGAPATELVADVDDGPRAAVW